MSSSMSIKINQQDRRRLLRKLGKDRYQEAVGAALLAAGQTYKGKIATYPTRRRITRESVYGEPFVSDRQRRFFFAALRDGRIDVPYRRGQSPGSQRLGQRWTVRRRQWHTVIVGNNASYAPFVQGPKRQSEFMRALGWKTTEDVAREHGGDIMDSVQQQISLWLNE